MVFSSPSFLFAFLPTVLVVHLLLPPRLRNFLLFLLSLLFYAYGEGWFTLLMLTSIVLNWGAALLMDRAPEGGRRRAILATALIANIAVLCFFKYAVFFVNEANRLLGAAGMPLWPVPRIHLPLGISFFTFQAMSYVIDCYRKRVETARDPLKVGLYIALFPQLIAGPIVRYGHIAAALVRRRISLAAFAGGLRRFIIGVAKKVLVANTLAVTTDRIFALSPAELTTPLAWLGTGCFIIQVYFDFSGYSDMAIGLGRMLGFRFPENFDYPYIGRSVREFWRRWHISLSSWFRDYLYIPLGGSRRGEWRTALNLVVVFTLVGLWHGASWTYILFGFIHGSLLALEHAGFGAILKRGGALVGHLYFWMVIVFTFALFRASDLPQAFTFWKALVGHGAPAGMAVGSVLSPWTVAALVTGTLFAMPLWRVVLRRLMAYRERLAFPVRRRFERAGILGFSIGCLLLLLAAVVHGSMESYNPFVYFRF